MEPTTCLRERGPPQNQLLEGGDLGRADSVNNISRVPHVGTREDNDEETIGANQQKKARKPRRCSRPNGGARAENLKATQEDDAGRQAGRKQTRQAQEKTRHTGPMNISGGTWRTAEDTENSARALAATSSTLVSIIMIRDSASRKKARPGARDVDFVNFPNSMKDSD